MICILGALCASSLLVFCLAAIRLRHGSAPLDQVNRSVPDIYWASALFALLLVGRGLLGLLSQPEATGAVSVGLIRNGLWFNGLAFLALLVPMTYLEGVETSDFGFHFGNWRRQLSEGVLGFLAAVGPVLGLWAATSQMRNDQNKHGLFQLLDQDSSLATLAWVCLAAVVAAPLLEELLYRVVLQTWLEKRIPPRVALVIVAVVFAAVHRLPDAIPLLPLALVLGYFYQQRRSFMTIVLIHVLFNGTNLALALLTMNSGQ